MHRATYKSLETCKGSRCMIGALKYSLALNASLTSLFNPFSIDFTELLPTISQGGKLLLVCVEHVTNWLVACSTLAATPFEVTKFISIYGISTFRAP